MLVETLRRIRTARDTRGLFERLGYTPDDTPFEGEAHVVARWRGFKVIAVDGADPSNRARSLARWLGKSGERALAAVVGPDRSLALAAPILGTPGATPALVLSLDQPDRAALHQLTSLRPASGSTGLTHALKVTELLASEVAGQRFFAAFRMTLERMAASLAPEVPTTERRVVALLALTRVLFLYFVQAKGWLDGRPDYLRRLLDTSLTRRRPFHRGALEPLFFGTLNQPAGVRSRHCASGAIPYLNGGLFEPHPIERRHGMPAFSNVLWRAAFDGVFERFRFCVREAHEVDAIAPDMLGRVFERLMDAGERHSSGTFYTPERVVRQIVDAALATALCGVGGLSDEVAHGVVACNRIPDHDRARASAAVRCLRILDPATGSGAFLLGALEALTEIRLALEGGREPRRRLRIRREVLSECLFGVDVNPMAVRLAELRLWLAVVADDPTAEIAAITPLPNLDGIVRQGDTLLDPLGAARACHQSFPGLLSATATAHVRAARRELFDARRDVFVRVSRALRRLEHALAGRLLSEALSATEQAHADLAAAALDRDLFGRQVRLTRAREMRLGMLRQNRDALRQARRDMELGVLPFFSFEVHTPDVLAAGGFSLVIGNPPWVRAEHLSPARRRMLQHRFTWWRATRERGYAHLPDLAIAFLERARELTAPGGAIGLLLPSKLASAGYGEPARQHLVRETSLVYAHRVPEQEATQFGATTYPLALVLRNRPPEANHHVFLGFDRARAVPQRSLSGDGGPWILRPAADLSAIRELLASGRPLREVAEASLGIKTGADAVLVGELVARTGGIATVRFGPTTTTIEPSALREAIRGRDVTAFAARSRRVLLWGYGEDGHTLDRLPPRAARHIRANAARLDRRADYRTGPRWTLFRLRASTSSHRVVWPDLARRPRAVVLEAVASQRAVPLNTCYVAPTPDHETALVVAAVMNSSWAGVLVNVVADEARGGYCRVNARVAGEIPIPIAGPGFEELADVSARAHGGHPVAQPDLDDAVANALHLPISARRALARMAADLFGSAAGRR